MNVQFNRMTVDDARSMLGGQTIRFDDGSFKPMLEAAARNAGLRLDASDVLFAQQQLEYALSKEIEDPDLPMSAMSIFPINTEVPEWAETYSWREYTAAGRWKRIADGADDLPKMAVGASKQVFSVETWGAMVDWSVVDVIQNARLGAPIETRKMRAAYRSHNELMNGLMWTGDTASGIKGLLNQGLKQAEATSTLASMTASQIIDFFVSWAISMVSDTKGVERPNMLVLPIEQYGLLVKTRQGSADNTESLLSELQRKLAAVTGNPNFEIRQAWELAGAGAAVDGAASDIAVLLNNSPDVVDFHAAMVFRQFPPQLQGLRILVPILARFGSLNVYRPQAVQIRRGI